MKILLASDFHIHVWPNFGVDSETGISKRLLEQKDILNQIIKIIKQEEIKEAIFAGDLFHKVGEIPVEALNVAFNFFDDLKFQGVDFYLIRGNHDLIKRENPHDYQIATKIFGSFRSELTLNGAKIKLIDFHTPINEDDIKGFDLVILHKTPINSRVGNYEFSEGVDWQKLSKNNKMVCFGHIHQKQQLADNCFVLGSPMHLAFGDIGERGVYILDTVTNELKFIKLNYAEFKTVNTVDEVVKDGSYYRILNSDKPIKDENVITTVIKPKYYTERLKGNNFLEILKEWLTIKGKDETYLTVIKDIINEKIQNFRKVFRGKIKKVEIKNFISIENIKYNVENGFTLVKGVNGSGKTNLFDAIYWCFFGKTTKELNSEELIRWGAKESEVSVYLEGVKGGLGKIVRNSKDGLHVYKSIEDSSPLTEGLRKDDRQKMLEESLLGINEDIFLSACYFSQENLQMLTQLSDTDKTNIINNLLGFDMYCSLYDKVFEQIKQLNFDKQICEQEKDRISFEIKKNNSNIEILENQEAEENKSIIECVRLINEYSQKIKDLLFDIANPREDLIIENRINYDIKLAEVQEKISVTNITILNLKTQKEEMECKKVDLLNEINNIKNEIHYLKSDQDKYKIEYENLDKNKLGEKCNKCGSLINLEAIETFKQEKQLKINELGSKILSLETDLLKKNSIDYQALITLLEEKKKNIETQEVIKDNFNNEIVELNNKKYEQSEKQRKLESYRATITAEQKEYNSLIEVYEKRVHEHEKQKINIQNSINKINEEINKFEQEIKENKMIIDKTNKEIEILEFWKEAFSPKGIKSLLLDKFCNEFNTILSEYVSLIFNNNLIANLSPTKTIKSGEERNEMGLVIKMLKNDTEIVCNYKNLSGGQKRKIDVSLCLALNKWVSNKYEVPNGLLGLIILDEIFSFLDREGEESIGDLVYNEGKDKGIFIISHTPSLESFASKIWEVTTEKGVSKLTC